MIDWDIVLAKYLAILSPNQIHFRLCFVCKRFFPNMQFYINMHKS
jgi:hypothetical protein